MPSLNPVSSAIEELHAARAIQYVKGTDSTPNSLVVTRKGYDVFEPLNVKMTEKGVHAKQVKRGPLAGYDYRMSIDDVKKRAQELAPAGQTPQEAKQEVNALLKLIVKPVATIHPRRDEKHAQARSHAHNEEVAAGPVLQKREASDIVMIKNGQPPEQQKDESAREALLAFYQALAGKGVRFQPTEQGLPKKLYINEAAADIFWEANIPYHSMKQHVRNAVRENVQFGEHDRWVDADHLWRRLAPVLTPEQISAKLTPDLALSAPARNEQKSR